MNDVLSTFNIVVSGQSLEVAELCPKNGNSVFYRIKYRVSPTVSYDADAVNGEQIQTVANRLIESVDREAAGLPPTRTEVLRNKWEKEAQANSF